MSQRPFHLIHASDFHLEQPPHGLAEVPEHLRDALLDAPYRAATKVFDQAIAESADFLVLAGDILHPELTGPRGPLFLLEQFHRLAERKIKVYWAAAPLDQPAAWPAAFKLPDNVHHFSPAAPEELHVERGDEPLARLLGLSQTRRKKLRPADFWPADGVSFSMVAAHGSVGQSAADRDALAGRGIQYWALGGHHARTSTQHTSSLVHYPGTHQGRTPRETGAHGCTLVEVDATGRPRTTFLPCDVLRFISEDITLEEATTREQLRQTLDERLKEVLTRNPVPHVLVTWNVTGEGPLLRRLRRGSLSTELLDEIRRQGALESTQVWSIGLTAESTVPAVSDTAEATLLGDFLTAMQSRLAADQETLLLDRYLSQRHASGAVADAVSLADVEVRARVLQRASALGRDLLTGEEHAR